MGAHAHTLSKNPYHFLAESDTDFNLPSRLDPRGKGIRATRSCYLKYPLPDPSPKGGALVLTFTFGPLPALARERCRVRSLGLFCWPRAFRGQPLCKVFSPNPFREARRHFMPSGRGNPRRGFPRQKQSTGLFLLPFLRFAVAYPSRTPAGVLSGDFAACGLRPEAPRLWTLVSLLKKAQAKTFRFCFSKFYLKPLPAGTRGVLSAGQPRLSFSPRAVPQLQNQLVHLRKSGVKPF